MDRLPDGYESETLSQLRVAYVIFDEVISPEELPLFRGAVIRMSGGDVLFHNHEGEGYRYLYPKVQYKIIDGRAAVLGINEGASMLTGMFSGDGPVECMLNRRAVELHTAYRDELVCAIEVSENMYRYSISNWLPFNRRNYHDYMCADGLAEKVMLLEKILTGNILSMAKGLNIYLPSRIICKIDTLDSNGASVYKGVELMNFSATFRCNVTLPQWIGLGKSSSLNHGTISII